LPQSPTASASLSAPLLFFAHATISPSADVVAQATEPTATTVAQAPATSSNRRSVLFSSLTFEPPVEVTFDKRR
jgi:hypothetical protein